MQNFLRFALVGGGGFLVDACITQWLIWLGVSPFAARVPAILLAMLFTWLANRSFTYRVGRKASLGEAGRYFAVAAVMGVLNYGIYSLLTAFGCQPIISIVIASAVQMVLGFFGYSKFAFRQRE